MDEAASKPIPFLVAEYKARLKGDRFLMVLEEESPETMTLVVVPNWFEELERLVPTNN